MWKRWWAWNLNATVMTESCRTRSDTPPQGQHLLNIESPLRRWIKQGKPTKTLMKNSAARDGWWNIYRPYSWWKLLFGLMRMTTSHASTNNNISTSNLISNPASDHLQHKRHQQHIPTSGTVTNFGYSDWGISPSASWTRISRNIIQNKIKYSLMSSISWLVEGQQVDRKKDFLQLNAWQQERRIHEAHNYRRQHRARLSNYRKG